MEVFIQGNANFAWGYREIPKLLSFTFLLFSLFCFGRLGRLRTTSSVYWKQILLSTENSFKSCWKSLNYSKIWQKSQIYSATTKLGCCSMILCTAFILQGPKPRFATSHFGRPVENPRNSEQLWVFRDFLHLYWSSVPAASRGLCVSVMNNIDFYVRLRDWLKAERTVHQHRWKIWYLLGQAGPS